MVQKSIKLLLSFPKLCCMTFLEHNTNILWASTFKITSSLTFLSSTHELSSTFVPSAWTLEKRKPFELVRWRKNEQEGNDSWNMWKDNHIGQKLKLVNAQTLSINKEPKPDCGKKSDPILIFFHTWNQPPGWVPVLHTCQIDPLVPSRFYTWPCSLSVLILSILEPGPSSS